MKQDIGDGKSIELFDEWLALTSRRDDVDTNMVAINKAQLVKLIAKTKEWLQ